MKIDLNADLGEGYASDAELLTLVSSANIACGFHGGLHKTMQACVREAIKNGVAIGAHPSFPDRKILIRRAMQLPPETVYAQTLYQIGALAAITRCARRRNVSCQTARHVIQPGSERGTTGRRHRRNGIRLRSGIDSRRAGGSRLIRAGKQYGLTTRGSVCRSRLSGRRFAGAMTNPAR